MSNFNYNNHNNYNNYNNHDNYNNYNNYNNHNNFNNYNNGCWCLGRVGPMVGVRLLWKEVEISPLPQCSLG